MLLAKVMTKMYTAVSRTTVAEARMKKRFMRPARVTKKSLNLSLFSIAAIVDVGGSNTATHEAQEAHRRRVLTIMVDFLPKSVTDSDDEDYEGHVEKSKWGGWDV